MRKQTIIHGRSDEHPLRVLLLSVSPLSTDHRLADRTVTRICVNLLDIRNAQSVRSDSRRLFTLILRNPYNASLFLILLLSSLVTPWLANCPNDYHDNHLIQWFSYDYNIFSVVSYRLLSLKLKPRKYDMTQVTEFLTRDTESVSACQLSQADTCIWFPFGHSFIGRSSLLK